MSDKSQNIDAGGTAGSTIPNLHRFAHEAMACVFELYLVEQDARYARQAAEAAFVEIGRLERDLSRFIADSDISRLNALRAGQATSVGIEAFECIQIAVELHAATRGAFDISVGSDVSDPTLGGTASLPAYSGPRSAIHLLEFDAHHRYVGVRADGIRLDLGGIGKGYAVDRAAWVLREWSIGAGLVHAGQSTVFALGSPPGAETWHIALRDPRDPNRVIEHVALRDAALSGSGQALHGDHIIDPRSGIAPRTLHGAWAIAPTATEADALSTAFMVLSRDEIAEVCAARRGTAGMILPADRANAEVVVIGSRATRPEPG